MADRPRGLSRRALLASGSAGAAGLAIGSIGASALGDQTAADPEPGRSTIAFLGDHQSGVTTAPQTHGAFVAFDLRDDVDAGALRRLLRIWTDDIERLMSGRPGLADTEPELAERPDRLTVTVGVGARAVKAAGAKVPSWLGPLPDFTIDRLEERWSGGDVLLQVCSDDKLTLAHAIRLLTKEARSFASVRWVQRGFRGPVKEENLPRNMMGQVDGTATPSPSERDTLVWVGEDSRKQFGDQPAWLTGGTTMVLRRIAMNLDTWDRLDRPGRESAIGRRLDDGRPLTGGRLKDNPDLTALDANGLEVIEPFAHVRRARTDDPSQRFLRRPYNYDEAPEPGKMTNAGLLFVTFQADLEKQFIPIQTRLAELDLLNEWTVPIGSAVFAVLPGVRRGGFLGESLFS